MKNLEMLEYYVNECLWSMEQDLNELNEQYDSTDDCEELECRIEELEEKMNAISELLEIF